MLLNNYCLIFHFLISNCQNGLISVQTTKILYLIIKHLLNANFAHFKVSDNQPNFNTDISLLDIEMGYRS